MTTKLTKWMQNNIFAVKKYSDEPNEPIEIQAIIHKTVRLSTIKIKHDFSDHMPNSDKLAAKYNYTKNQIRINKKYGRNRNVFQSPIILDKRNNLVDGYTSYLIAKMLGVKKVEVIIQKIESR